MMGAPGPVLVHVTGALLLPAPVRIRCSPGLGHRIPRGVGVVLLFGAETEALPL